MDKIEEIRAKIGECDDIIIEQLAVRMSHIQEIYHTRRQQESQSYSRSRRKSRQMHLRQSLATMNLRKRYLIFSNIS